MRKFYDAEATSGGYSANDSIPTAEQFIKKDESGVFNEQDIAHMMKEYAKLHAVGFMNWRNDVRNFDKNIIRNNPDITTKQLYKEYLKTLV